MTDEPELERLISLLPFYVNGTLDNTARQQVEVAVAFSPRLKKLLAEERELAEAVSRDTAQRLKAGKGDAPQPDQPDKK